MSTPRWLLLPTVFIVLQWACYLAPAKVIVSTPALWTTADANASKSLKLPHTRVQSLELGWHAALFSACVQQLPVDNCTHHVVAANAAVGPTSALTPAQLKLSHLRGDLLLEDEERSVTQRVLGFFSFVNLVWLISIFGGVLTIGPCVLYVFGETMAKLLKSLYESLLVPMHKAGVFELLAYAAAFLLSAQSCRYPVQHASAATLVGLSGAVGVVPCWAYSTALWAEKSFGKEEEFATLSSALLAFSLAPLALLHASSLIGCFTVASIYAACGFVMGPFLGGFYIGFRSLDAVWRCLLVSAALIVTFAILKIGHLLGPWAAPFAMGAMTLGNVGYFLALLIVSSQWRSRRAGLSYGTSNALMLLSVVAAALVGSVFAMPSCVNTASTFFVLWVMEKEMEANWGPAAIAVLFCNFVVLYFLAHHLHTHPEIITSLFDPAGVHA